MLSSAKYGIDSRRGLEDLSAQLSYIVKSLEFIRKVCQDTSVGNSDPIHRLEVCGLILQNKIDDLNTMVKKLNKKASLHTS
jgi:hypothetical protein